MAFRDIEQKLINECIKETIDIETIKMLIEDGADINAFDDEYEQMLYDEILDYYMDERQLLPSNLYKITEIFIENNLILNPKPEDCDYFMPDRFRFLPPERICIETFKILLEKGSFSFGDLEYMISDSTLDLHLDDYHFYDQTQYTEKDSLIYCLELIYWACAYSVKVYPEKCSKDVLEFNWFEREKNKVELVRENRSTSVFVEDLETHKRAKIDGWTMKY